MLAAGKEWVQQGANPYVRVANTCPACYACCESNSDFTHHGVKNAVPRCKHFTKAIWTAPGGAVDTPVCLNIFKAMKNTTPGAMILVKRGSSVMTPMEGKTRTPTVVVVMAQAGVTPISRVATRTTARPAWLCDYEG